MGDTSARKRGMPHEEDGLAGAVASSSIHAVDIDEETTPYLVVKDDGLHYQQSPMVVEETHTRSLVKGLTWRFVASFTTIVIAKIVTGETAAAFQIGFFEFFAKLAIYYV